jgi:hypothetical protein
MTHNLIQKIFSKKFIIWYRGRKPLPKNADNCSISDPLDFALKLL